MRERGQSARRACMASMAFSMEAQVRGVRCITSSTRVLMTWRARARGSPPGQNMQTPRSAHAVAAYGRMQGALHPFMGFCKTRTCSAQTQWGSGRSS